MAVAESRASCPGRFINRGGGLLPWSLVVSPPYLKGCPLPAQFFFMSGAETNRQKQLKCTNRNGERKTDGVDDEGHQIMDRLDITWRVVW